MANEVKSQMKSYISHIKNCIPKFGVLPQLLVISENENGCTFRLHPKVIEERLADKIQYTDFFSIQLTNRQNGSNLPSKEPTIELVWSHTFNGTRYMPNITDKLVDDSAIWEILKEWANCQNLFLQGVDFSNILE